MSRIAVLLPGIGYTLDRSLLYYAGKIALSNGYELLPVPYTGFPKGIKGNPEKMQQAFAHALEETEKILTSRLIGTGILDEQGHAGISSDMQDAENSQSAEVLFISKSIGTAVAAAYEKRHALHARNVYYTPLSATFRFIEKNGSGSEGIVFHGTADPWATDEDIIGSCNRLQLPLTLIRDANHSLETGNVLRDLSYLQEIMEKTENYISISPVPLYADKNLAERFEFRTIHQDECDQAIMIEQICFPPNEACSARNMRDRIIAAAEFFLVAIDNNTGKIAGFLNGVATNEERLRDAFFTDASLHNPTGNVIMLTGLDVLPEYRGQGLARELVHRYQQKARLHGRRLLVLTCLPEKVEMYRKFGFIDCGISDSHWGGVQWHEMSCAIRAR